MVNGLFYCLHAAVSQKIIACFLKTRVRFPSLLYSFFTDDAKVNLDLRVDVPARQGVLDEDGRQFRPNLNICIACLICLIGGFAFFPTEKISTDFWMPRVCREDKIKLERFRNNFKRSSFEGLTVT